MRAADCVIAYALPTSQTGFIHKLRSRSHYVSGFAGGWPQYRTTCELIRRGIATCRRYGVEVREEVHAGELPSLFRYETVILFAHSVDKTGDQQSRQTAGQTIELWDAYVGDRKSVV